MKNLYLLLASILLTTSIFAQAPEGFNYQALARDSAGDIIVNTTIAVQFDLRETTAAGTIIYTETLNPTTNGNGVFNLVMGQGTTTFGVFNTIDWASNSHFLEVSIDLENGTAYTSLGTSQLLSVPYALHSKTAGSVTETQTLEDALTLGNIANSQIKSVTDPTDEQDAATKAYVDVLETLVLNVIPPEDLLAAGITVDVLIAAGVSVADLYAGGVTAADLINEGITLVELLAGGVSVVDLLAAGVSVADIYNGGGSTADLVAAGVNYWDLRNGTGLSFFQLFSDGAFAGMTGYEIYNYGASLTDLFNAGAWTCIGAAPYFSANFLKQETGGLCIAAESIAGGTNDSLAQLIAVYGLQSVVRGVYQQKYDPIYTPYNAFEYTMIRELYDLGASVADFLNEGFSVSDLLDGGITTSELLAAGITVPDAPVIGTATSVDTEATIAFTAPANNGGSPITSYTVISSPEGHTGTLNQSASGTITVTGLTNGTTYTFTITATNAIGTSEASTISNSITP